LALRRLGSRYEASELCQRLHGISFSLLGSLGLIGDEQVSRFFEEIEKFIIKLLSSRSPK